MCLCISNDTHIRNTELPELFNFLRRRLNELHACNDGTSMCIRNM